MGIVYHVAKTGNDFFKGTMEKPFLTISKAAELAAAGDRIVVHEGEYREWVKPANGGTNSLDRIVYEAAPGEHVVIKGSERITGWEKEEGTVWKKVLPDSFFGEFNPYRERLYGDWFETPKEFPLHLGDVYLNGRSFYEAPSLEAVKKAKKRMLGHNWAEPGHAEPILHPEETIYQWYAKADEKETVIWANFQGADPNEELVEINVRKCCFFPVRTGRNYITVRGFEMAQAACPWTPPTSNQEALVGANWSKGWIIENNKIHDAKCSGISIGKEESTGHNFCTRGNRKPGYQYQIETVCRALQIGWSKETVGSHIIRNNEIYDCGQNGIVGHLGCVFSEIYGNHIYNIAVKYEYFGYEIAGIKLHVAIDVQIHHNQIDHCTLGTWLDWQAQGTRVSCNLYHHNDRDFMIEVTHGPYLVDNNIFASKYNFANYAQGGAYVHNLCCGMMWKEDVPNRSTPYHFPHTTQMAGFAVVYGNDDRFFQNIFVGGNEAFVSIFKNGTEHYEGCPVSLEEYIERVKKADCGDLESHLAVKQPAYLEGNVYLKGAPASLQEQKGICLDTDPKVQITEDETGVYAEMDVAEKMLGRDTRIFSTETLGTPRIAEAPYENPDGTGIVLDRDYTGAKRSSHPHPGPFENLHAGHNKICVWRKQ